MDDLQTLAGIDCFSRAASALAISSERHVVLGTGFPVGGAPETDGPPGAFALADALTAMGRDVTIASWEGAIGILSQVRPDFDYHAVPIDADGTWPGGSHLLVTIEVCGKCADGSFRNMKGADIRHLAPDFENHFGTRAFATMIDGGNEYGSGDAPAEFFAKWGIMPPISVADHVLPGITSNYAAYALIRALEFEHGRGLLPDPAAHLSAIRSMIAKGCVDGMSGRAIDRVDGHPLSDTRTILAGLHAIG